jgi:ornithine decarboxylase
MVYAAQVMELVNARFGNVPRVMAEPGRGLVAEAGMIAAEVLLVSKKSDTTHTAGCISTSASSPAWPKPWTRQSATSSSPTATTKTPAPCVLAGPSCDSADVLYEKRPVQLPLGLKAGDRIIIRNCGAYTSTYSSVWFNGFPPLDVEVI